MQRGWCRLAHTFPYSWFGLSATVKSYHCLSCSEWKHSVILSDKIWDFSTRPQMMQDTLEVNCKIIIIVIIIIWNGLVYEHAFYFHCSHSDQVFKLNLKHIWLLGPGLKLGTLPFGAFPQHHASSFLLLYFSTCSYLMLDWTGLFVCFGASRCLYKHVTCMVLKAQLTQTRGLMS